MMCEKSDIYGMSPIDAHFDISRTTYKLGRLEIRDPLAIARIFLSSALRLEACLLQVR